MPMSKLIWGSPRAGPHLGLRADQCLFTLCVQHVRRTETVNVGPTRVSQNRVTECPAASIGLGRRKVGNGVNKKPTQTWHMHGPHQSASMPFSIRELSMCSLILRGASKQLRIVKRE